MHHCPSLKVWRPTWWVSQVASTSHSPWDREVCGAYAQHEWPQNLGSLRSAGCFRKFPHSRLSANTSYSWAVRS